MKILLVDDEADIRKIAKLSLEAVGKHEAVLAADAQEGLALAAKVKPDLIVMDVMMPGMDGIAAFSELRRDPALAAIPVIFMTAKVQRSEAEHYKQLGARGVIAKPFDPMTLPADLAAILDGR
jgi:CheY-like chemotaxis protein